MERTRGLVTGSRRSGDVTEYTVFDGERYHRVVSKKRIKGRFVELNAQGLEEIKENILEEVKNRFFRKISFKSHLPDEISFLREKMETLWKELAFLKITGERPLVYFDPDADGIVSLLLLMEVLRVSYRPLNPWQLETGSGLSPDPGAPLYVVLDMGSAPDMVAGVRLLGSLGPLFIVDHHYTPTEPSNAVLINPTTRDPKLSAYTTAVLVSYLVESWVKKDRWVRVAAAGDRTDVLKWGEEDRKRALALEVSVDVFGYNPSVWRDVLEGDLWKPLWEVLEERFRKIDEMADKREEVIGGRRVLFVSYPYPGFHYPHKGKVASWYQEKGDYDLVVVREAPRERWITVSLRGTMDLFPLLERVVGEGLGKGWGHPNALSFRVADGDALLEIIRGWLEHEGGEGDREGENKKEK